LNRQGAKKGAVVCHSWILGPALDLDAVSARHANTGLRWKSVPPRRGGIGGTLSQLAAMAAQRLSRTPGPGPAG
jgi:hypothetical protein